MFLPSAWVTVPEWILISISNTKIIKINLLSADPTNHLTPVSKSVHSQQTLLPPKLTPILFNRFAHLSWITKRHQNVLIIYQTSAGAFDIHYAEYGLVGSI
jgi:hypothetical protein